jgi:hypothetical protein
MPSGTFGTYVTPHSRIRREKPKLAQVVKKFPAFNEIRFFYRILRRNCLLSQVIEGKIKGGIEVTGRRGRRRRKLLDDLKQRRGYICSGKL